MRQLVFVLTVACLLGDSSRASAQEQVGVVDAVEGQAEVLHAGASTWTPLGDKAPVLLGDQLRTMAAAKLRVVLREDSVLQVGPSSQLEITEQLLAPTIVSRFQLLFGTLRAIVTERYSQLQGRFEVETPTAIAGVRGTSFIARYDTAQEETLVVGLEDVTRVRGRTDGRGEVEVGPGMATRVRRGGRPVAPAPLPEAELQRLRGATEPGAGAGASSRPRANARDARRPQRGGERALSREEQAVDQPLSGPGRPKPPPPPPPIPPRGPR